MLEDALVAHVLCSSFGSEEMWSRRAAALAELRIVPLSDFNSAIGVVHQVSRTATAPFLICQDDVWFGRGIANHVAALIEELNDHFPNWAVCANRGIRWDGEHLFDFTYWMDASGLQTGVCAQAVTCIDDGLILVNPAALRKHVRRAPLLTGSSLGILLSLECLQNESIAAVSPRLMSMRPRAALKSSNDVLQSDPEFRDYYRKYFINHYFHTPKGILELSETIDYRQIAEPSAAFEGKDVLSLYDEALTQARKHRKPTLTICCRTQFRRLEMLERAIFSFSCWKQHGLTLLDTRIQLITDRSQSEVERYVSQLQASYPASQINCRYETRSTDRYSRTNLLLSAIEHACTDYIWFVDDDDFVNAPAACAVARCLVPGASLLILGSSSVIGEVWIKSGSDGEVECVQAEFLSSFPPGSVMRVLNGENYIPICGVIFPVELMKRRLRGVRALGDYTEDYFLLLLGLTSSKIETVILNVEIAAISRRENENTPESQDRSAWNLSLATFLLEILNQPEEGSPFLWKLGNSQRW